MITYCAVKMTTTCSPIYWCLCNASWQSWRVYPSKHCTTNCWGHVLARCQEIILTLFRTSLHPYSSLRLKLLNYCENPKQITVIIWLELFKETWSKISHWLIMNFEKSQGVETVGLQSALTNRFIISVDICVLVLVCLWRHTLPMWVANLTTVP